MSAVNRGSSSRPGTITIDPTLADSLNQAATSTTTTTRTLTPQPEALTPRTTLPDYDTLVPQEDGMLSTLQAVEPPSAFDRSAGAIEAARTQLGDFNDSRSSSLSELGDGPSDGEDGIRANYTLTAAGEYDSEAETERLHDSPTKLPAPDATVEFGTVTGRTPSRLRREMVADRESSESVSPSTRIAQGGATMDELAGLSGLSALAAVATEPVIEQAGSYSPRKRKRLTPDASPISDEEVEEPARKRSASARINGGSAALDAAEKRAADENDAGDMRALPNERGEAMVDVVEAAQEPDEDEPALLKSSKAKKGKRKGKKAKEPDTMHRSIESVPPAATERQPDPEGDDEPVAVGEELNKKRNAMEGLEEIQRQFVLMRSKLSDERITQLDAELESLKQPNSSHPELLAMLRCIDERLAEKKQIEDMTLHYKLGALGNRIICERRQLQSQYFQTIREIRDEYLYLCNKTFLKLRQERNLFGADDPDYAYMYNPDRAEQIKRQTAYNKEVSILSGIAKYVGFPAAPDLNGARTNELDNDLRALRHPLSQANHNAFHSAPSSTHLPRFGANGNAPLSTPVPQKSRPNQPFSGSAASTVTAVDLPSSTARPTPTAAQPTPTPAPATLRQEETLIVAESSSLADGQGKRSVDAAHVSGPAREEQQQQQQREEERSPKSLPQPQPQPQQLNAFARQRSEQQQRFMARSPFAGAAGTRIGSPGIAQGVGERVGVFRR
ncbi:hypothetical protein H2199_001222 [Coniosporium tulheliwenetii]|uniref:Uncharacterized protein n=1 Tax=Coniosporium tulheliwenetii TaxID=3383036 RepID=A0ACC2ZLE6_9PEZI|nr:hypothetical protein H2199_001222 [Cladosporium sp. JES 115]